jgi:hypothetical protein
MTTARRDEEVGTGLRESMTMTICMGESLPSKSDRCHRSSQRCQRQSPRVHRRVAISLLPIFILLASVVVSSVKSSQAFVSACDKIPRHSPSQIPKNYNIGSIQASDSDSDSYRMATTSSLLVARAKSHNPNAPGAGDDRDAATSSATPPHSYPRPQEQFIEYQKRKADWADRYTTLQSLRETFGTNKHRIWGDLDAASARRLYKTLLPKALLELVQAGVQPQDLAPLAYQARVAAKLYARERCTLPARLMANIFDGVRSLKRYGKWQPVGMSYEQVWDKYQKAVMEDWEVDGIDEELTDEDIAIRSICMRILEASTRTNERVDRWTLPPDASEREEREDLTKIAQTLENDVRKLLNPVSSTEHLPSPLRGFTRVFRWLAQFRMLVNGMDSKE